MAEWSDKFNTLKSFEFPVNETKMWKCAVEEHKTKGTLQLNLRQWNIAAKEGGYSGPAKNGFIIPITSTEDIDTINKLLQQIITFTDEIKEIL